MDNQLVPSSRTHVDGLTAAERFAAYHDAARPLCDMAPLRDRAAEDARCSGWLVDDIFVGRSAFTWTRFHRRGSQARQGGGFLVEVCKGVQYGEVDGHPVQLDKDRIVLRDLSRPFNTVGYAEELLGFIIPRHRIARRDWLERQSPVVTFPVATCRGQMLLNTVQSVMALLPGLTRSGASGVSSGLVGLLNGLLATETPTAESSRVGEASLETMKMFLIRNLHDPALSVTTLTQAFHSSRAKVYRLFAEEGGVAAFIRQQRLDRCLADLRRAEKKPGAVQHVAARWGFLDPYHFSRLFKGAFGVPPSAWLGADPTGGGDWDTGKAEASPAPIHAWVSRALETNGQKSSRHPSMAGASDLH